MSFSELTVFFRINKKKSLLNSNAIIAQLVEHHIGNVEVLGSNPNVGSEIYVQNF